MINTKISILGFIKGFEKTALNSSQAWGTGIGAVGGGLLGNFLTEDPKERWKNVLTGAAGGGLLGYGVGGMYGDPKAKGVKGFAGATDKTKQFNKDLSEVDEDIKSLYDQSFNYKSLTYFSPAYTDSSRDIDAQMNIIKGVGSNAKVSPKVRMAIADKLTMQLNSLNSKMKPIIKYDNAMNQSGGSYWDSDYEDLADHYAEKSTELKGIIEALKLRYGQQ